MARKVHILLVLALLGISPSILAQGSLRDQLRSLLNVSHARLPPSPASSPKGVGRGMNVARLLQLLGNGERAAPVGVSSIGAVTTARVGRKSLRIDPDRGAVQIRDDRGYEAAFSAVVTESDMVARASDLLDAIGVDPGEAFYKSRTLVGEDKPNGGAPTGRYDVAHKLLVERMVANMVVQGERLIVTFALDGTLRSVAGRWRRLDLDRSRLSVSATRDQIGELALAKVEAEWLQRNVVVSPGKELRVLTALVSNPAGGGRFLLRPIGRVYVPLVGPGGTMYEEYPFDL